MPDVVVMYGDLSIVRVPFDEAGTLRRDDVIAIAISHPDQPVTGLRKKRQQFAIRYDYYVLVWDDTGCYLGGYDDNLYWFSLTEPWKKYGEGFVHCFPYVMPENSITFKGVMISPEDFTKAEAICKDAEGPMM